MNVMKMSDSISPACYNNNNLSESIRRNKSIAPSYSMISSNNYDDDSSSRAYSTSTSSDPISAEGASKLDMSSTLDSLPELPEIYTSLRNALSICDLSADEISKRVSRFMQLNEIHCQYNNARPGRVVCSTIDIPKFYVQLWERRKETTTSILVEIQRRRGCPIAMQRIRAAISRAILYGDYRYSPSLLRKQQYRPVPASIKQMVGKKEEQRKNKVEKDLEACIGLLESPRRDHNHLGMESLSILTDPCKVHPEDARVVGRILVCGHGKYGKELQNEVEDFLHMVEEEEGSFGDDFNDDGMCYVLKALANSLSLLAEEKCQCLLSNGSSSGSNGANKNSSLEALRNPSGLVATFWTNITQMLLRIENSEQECLRQHAAIAKKIIQTLEVCTTTTFNNVEESRKASTTQQNNTSLIMFDGGAPVVGGKIISAKFRIISLDPDMSRSFNQKYFQ